MNRYSIIFISFFFLYNSCSQEKHAPVYSNEKIYPDSSPGYEISYLFKLIGDSVFNAERKLIRIGMPANIKAGSAWGSFNIGGFKTAKTKWEVFYIITDFDSTTPQIIFDKNGNADFRDDTAFAIQPATPFYVSYKHPTDKTAQFKSEYRFYRGSADSSRENIHRLLTYKKGTPLPPRYMLLSKKYNIRKIQLHDSNIISLKDMDFDGMFTSKYDKIIAGDLEANPVLIKKPLQCKKVKKGVELTFGNKSYKLLSADKYGRHISLTPLDKIIDTVERLPSIIYSDENGNKKTLIAKNDKKYSVFYIWGTWCIGCLYQSKGFAEVMNSYSSSANFYCLNLGDSREKMKKYITEKKYPFQLYQITKETAEDKLFAEVFPTFIVADDTKKILLRTSSVDEIKHFFSKL